MAEIYPLTLPSHGELTRVQFARVPVQATSRNVETRERDVFEFSGDTWRVEASIAARTVERAQKWIEFFLRLDGMAGTFLMGDPLRMIPKGTPSGAPVVNGAANQGSALATEGWTPNAVEVLKAGDLIQTGAGLTARLYWVMDDVTADALGEAVLNVRPRIVVPPADQSAIVTQNPMGLFQLTESSAASWLEANRREISGLSFSAESVHAP